MLERGAGWGAWEKEVSEGAVGAWGKKLNSDLGERGGKSKKVKNVRQSDFSSILCEIFMRRGAVRKKSKKKRGMGKESSVQERGKISQFLPHPCPCLKLENPKPKSEGT